MRPSTLEILACPSCRRGYEAQIHARDGAEILSAALSCPGCGITIPVVEGFPLFTEPRLHAGLASAEAIQAMAARLFGADDDYRRYIALKEERGAQEDYAAYGPFNEATRSAEPMHRVLDTHLAPGDFILDTWCRTGWSGETLASRFPAQNVVAVWEGDNSVLGYRGFSYWLNHRRRSPNLDILFTDPERPLPFRDGAFAGLQGQDSLHRYALNPFAGECLRVVRKDGCLIFPHVHLTNSEPDPWFDRGCRQDHGLDYRAWLDAVLAGDGRQGYVLSEPQLFAERGENRIADTPETTDYNGAVLIADAARGASPPPSANMTAGTRLLVNPLFRISLQRMTARIDDGWRGGSVGHYLNRHPLYRRYLPQAGVPISQEQLLLIALAVTGRTVGDIGQAFGRPADEALRLLAPLIEADLLLPAPVTAAAMELQRFHANQLGPLAPDPLFAMLGGLADREEPQLHMADGSSSSGAEMLETIALLAGVLDARGLRAGDDVVLSGLNGPFGLLLLLAGMSRGLNMILSDTPRQGSRPALLVHSDDQVPADGFGEVSLPLGAVLNQASELDAGALQPAAAADARVGLPMGGATMRLPAASLVEAAYALRSSVDVGFVTMGRLDTPSGLFTALIGIASALPIQFERDD